MFIAKAPALATLRPGSRWVEVDARLGRRARGAGAREALRLGVLRHRPRRAAARRRLRHGDRRRRVDVRLRPRDGRRRAPVRLPRSRAARRRRRSRGRRAQRLAPRHRREVRRRDLDRRGDRRGRRRRCAPSVRERAATVVTFSAARVVFGAGRLGRDGRAPAPARRHARARRLRPLRDRVRARRAARGVAPARPASSRSSTTASPASRARARSRRRPRRPATASTASSASAAAPRSTPRSSARSSRRTTASCSTTSTRRSARGRQVPGPAAAVRRPADDLGHGLRGDDGRGRRLPAARDEDRRLAPATSARRSRSSTRRSTLSCPPGVTAVDRHRRAAPRARGVHGHPVRRAPVAAARRAAALPGREPVLGPVLRARDRARRPHPPHRGRGRRRHRGAHARWRSPRPHRRHRVLGRRRARPARARLPDRVAQARVAAAGLRRRGLRPARVRGRRDGAGRLPLHRRTPCRSAAPTAARLLDGGDDLAASLERLLEDVGAPTSLREIGYGEDDLAAVVQGALDQRRLLVGSPKEIGAAELEALLESVAVSECGLRRVAIVGAGTMGAGISQVFASNGIPTALVDSTPERTRRRGSAP